MEADKIMLMKQYSYIYCPLNIHSTLDCPIKAILRSKYNKERSSYRYAIM